VELVIGGGGADDAEQAQEERQHRDGRAHAGADARRPWSI
jgi:hypothetical protein